MISVCMATYNGESFVKEQLESILSQLPADGEVVIADDGSTDGTLSVIHGMNDSRIRVVTDGSSAKNLGPVYNFERALAAAEGDVIFLADQDDIWMPTKVQLVTEALKSACLVIHDGEFFGNSVPEGAATMWGARPFKAGVFSNWLKNTYTGCCMAFDRKVLDAALPFPKNLPMHDQWVGLVAERAFGSKNVVALDQALIRYRLHKNNATQLVSGKSRGLVQRVKWRWALLRSLLR